PPGWRSGPTGRSSWRTQATAAFRCFVSPAGAQGRTCAWRQRPDVGRLAPEMDAVVDGHVELPQTPALAAEIDDTKRDAWRAEQPHRRPMMRHADGSVADH